MPNNNSEHLVLYYYSSQHTVITPWEFPIRFYSSKRLHHYVVHIYKYNDDIIKELLRWTLIKHCLNC